MGGICGWIGLGEAGATPPSPVDLDAMRTRLAHRGGVRHLSWFEPPDPTPAVIADSAFNTEEAIASAWSAWGGDPAAFASRLEGSFSVAALDRRRGRLVLARDRLGEKPLYYAVTREGVAFASEIKALRAGGAVQDPALLPEALDAYLAFTYIPAPWTIHAAVRKVPAGHCVVFDVGGAAPRPPAAEPIRYWTLPDRTGNHASADQMLEALAAALRRRLPSGGRAGAFLSGGLDSSVVVALMAREGIARTPTFSIAFAETDLDESSHARRVAALAGCDHHEIQLETVEPDLVTRVVDQLDEPMADAATIPTYVLGREAAGTTPVVMTGDGADALLAGDHWFRRLKALDSLERLPGWGRAAVPLIAALGGGGRHRKARRTNDLVSRPQPGRYLSIREKWTHEERLEIYAEEFRRRVDVNRTATTYLGAPVAWRAGESVDAAMRLDAIHGLPEDLLMKGDKMCMAHGVESRSPFLDQDLVEWSARLEIDLLLRGSTSKYLLKKAAERLLPRDLIYRRKHGFQVPIGRWMKGPLRDLTEAAFSFERIRSQGIFDAAAIARLKERFERGPATPALDGRVWQIVAFQTWMACAERGGP